MFKNIIFDWAGVVKDAVNVQFWIVNRIFGKYGIDKISEEEFRQNWQQPYMNFYRKYIPNLDEKDEHRVYLEAILSEDCPKVNTYPGIVDLIKKIKQQGKFLAILSSDDPKTILPEIKEYGLENIFDDQIINIHDKTEGMKEIIRNNNLKVEETIIVGDSNHEIEIGKELGVKSVAVTWGFYPEDRLKELNPDYLVNNIKELEEILL